MAQMAQGAVHDLTKEKHREKGMSLMPLFPYIFVFRTIRGGLCLRYVVPCGTSGNAERGREMLREGNENGGREQFLAKP